MKKPMMLHALWHTQLNDDEYLELSYVVAALKGIMLEHNMREYVIRRVWRQMAQRHITLFAEYIQRLEDDPDRAMLNALCRDLDTARLANAGALQQFSFATEWTAAAPACRQ